jgi:hypothetical protein
MCSALAHLGTSATPWQRTWGRNPATSYAAFAEARCRAGDVVITFNYDDSLERELKRMHLWDVSQGYGFPLGSLEHPSDVCVLKLHGSINWLVSLFGGATSGTFAVERTTMGDHPVIHQADLRFLGYEEFSGHVFDGGGAPANPSSSGTRAEL